MEVETIRKMFRKKPFTGVELSLSSGERIVCPSPEVFVSEDFFASLDEGGEAVLVDPSAIVKMRRLPQRGSSARTGPGRADPSGRED
ncbi:MAG: hypothetical protein HY719_03805 [Planctomycetes bacterium]|nr:hypothetical protein [Planctomycetota bacterium]